MKKILMMAAVLCAGGAWADIPSTVKGWYTPEKYTKESLKAKWSQGGKEYSCTVDVEGKVIWGDEKPHDKAICLALEYALESYLDTYTLQDEVETIAKNLHSIFTTDGITIIGKDPNGSAFSYKLKFTDGHGIGSESGVEMTDPTSSHKITDEKSLKWKADNTAELYGWASQAVSGEAFDAQPDTGVGIPVRTALGGAALKYMNWRGVDRTSLYPDATSGRLAINGWSSASPAATDTVADLLTNGVGLVNNPAQSPALLSRTASGEVRYMALGRLNDIAADQYTPADGASITTNETDGAVTQGYASMYGFANADDAASSTSFRLPYVNGSGALVWQGLLGFFNTGLFELTAEGKVNLKGVEADANNLRVMTVSQSGDSAAIASTGISSIINTPIAVEDQKITVAGWDDATPAASETLADRLTNGVGQVNNPANSPALMVRTSSGGVQYMAMGRLASAAEPDGKSITVQEADNKLALGGYSTASVGQVPQKTADGLAWASLAPVDDLTIETNENHQIALYGFADAKPTSEADGAAIPFASADSDDLQWGDPMTFFAESVFKKSSTTGKILLNGTTEEGKVKVLAITGSGGDDQTVSGITFDGESVDGVVGGRVQLHNFGSPTSPYAGSENFADALTNTATSIANMSVPVRVPADGTTSGYSVKYVPMGKVTGIPAAAVDNVTVEVNETDPQNPYLQLHGAAGDDITLEAGQVYRIGTNGKGEFAKLGGDDDDATVSANEASIETYTGDDGGKYFRLRDWMDNREGEPHLLGWEEHELKYWEANGKNGIDVNDTGAGDEITLANFDTANEGGIPYAKKDGNGLGWLNGVDGRIPLLNTDAAPTTMAIGSSLEKTNISAVPTLNIKGYESASVGEVPKKTATGIVWDEAGGVADIEAGSGISITSNGTTKVIAHNFVAGAGISLTAAASGTGVTIASSTPTAGTVVDPHAEEITYLTEIWYDNTTHLVKAKRKTITVMVCGTVPAAEEFVVIRCASHAAEHTSASE